MKREIERCTKCGTPNELAKFKLDGETYCENCVLEMADIKVCHSIEYYQNGELIGNDDNFSIVLEIAKDDLKGDYDIVQEEEL